MEQATFFDLAVSIDVQKESFTRMNRKETQKKKKLAFSKGQKKEIPISIFQTEKCWMMIMMTALHLYFQSLLVISMLC